MEEKRKQLRVTRYLADFPPSPLPHQIHPNPPPPSIKHLFLFRDNYWILFFFPVQLAATYLDTKDRLAELHRLRADLRGRLEEAEREERAEREEEDEQVRNIVRLQQEKVREEEKSRRRSM